MIKIIIEPGDFTRYELFMERPSSAMVKDPEGDTIKPPENIIVGLRVGVYMIHAYEFADRDLLHWTYVHEKLEFDNEWTSMIATVAIATALGREYAVDPDAMDQYGGALKRVEFIVRKELDK